MFLKIARVQSTQQSGIKGVKIPFDPNIISFCDAIFLIVPHKKNSVKEEICEKKTDQFPGQSFDLLFSKQVKYTSEESHDHGAVSSD